MNVIKPKASIKMILSNGFDPDPRVYKEACSLAQAGYQVEILAWDRLGNFQTGIQKYTEGFSVRRFYFPSTFGSGLKQIGAFLKFKKSIKDYLKSQQFDILHCHDLDALIVGTSLGNKTTIVFDEHDIFSLYFKLRGGLKNNLIGFFLDKLQRFLLKRVDRHIVVTPKMQEIYKNPTTVITNAPNRELFEPYTPKVTDPNNIVIGYIGNVRYYEELVTMCNLVKKHSNISYLIAGGGTKLENLKEYIRDDSINNIHILGQYQVNQLKDLYSRIDITHLIYPGEASKISMPNKFFESIVTGKPIITNKGSEISEIVFKNNIGWIVESSSELDTLLKNLSEGKIILEPIVKNLFDIREKYFWDNNAKILVDLYDGLL